LSIALFWLGGNGYGELAFNPSGRSRRALVRDTDDQGTHLIVGFTDGKIMNHGIIAGPIRRIAIVGYHLPRQVRH